MNELIRRAHFLAILICLSVTALAEQTDTPQEGRREVRQTLSARRQQIKPEDAKAYEAALLVLKNPKAGETELYNAMNAMDPWLSTTEQINALVRIALKRSHEGVNGHNAALTLGHSRWAIPEPHRAEIKDMFRQAVLLNKEKPRHVNGMLWTLSLWGDNDWIWQHFAKTLRDNTLKICVLTELSDRKTAVKELLALIDRCQPKTSVRGWQNRFSFSIALVIVGDKRGVDIGIDLLNVGQTFMPKKGYPNFLSHNLEWLSGVLGYELAKDDSGKPLKPADGLKAMTVWWKANREKWEMDPPETLPAEKPLNPRQASRLAARLANEEYAKVTFSTPGGRPVGTVILESDELRAELENGKWVCKGWGSLGPLTTVTFDIRGGNSTVSIDYTFFEK